MNSTVMRPQGPVDLAVLAFQGPVPSEAIAAAVAEAVASGSVSVLDALVVERSATGDIHIVDVDAPEDAVAVLGFPAALPGLLGEEDAQAVASELAPGSGAVLIAWDNLWLAGISDAVRSADGVIAAYERIPAADLHDLLDAIDSNDEEQNS